MSPEVALLRINVPAPRFAAAAGAITPVKLTLTAFIYKNRRRIFIDDRCERAAPSSGGNILFQRHEPIAGMSGNAAALALSQALPLQKGHGGAEPPLTWRERLAQLDLVPD